MAKVLAVLRGKRQTKRFQRTVYLLPSMFTVGTLFCGYACIVSAMRADYATAAVFIGVAAVLDVLDGRIARLAGAASEFGGEFDSLADAISFGVAPAVLAFAWGLEALGRLGWAVGFLYVTATALRLARFNVQNQNPDKRYFVGMPSPAAAGVLASTVFAWPDGFGIPQAPVVALAVVFVPALMMVSRIRFRAFGALTLRPRSSFLVLLPHRSYRRSAGDGALHHGVQLPRLRTDRVRGWTTAETTDRSPGQRRWAQHNRAAHGAGRVTEAGDALLPADFSASR